MSAPAWKTALGLAARLALGAAFAGSGLGKLLAPREEFAAVIETYELLPAGVVPGFAAALPWAELLAGVFLILGHLTRAAAAVSGAMLLSFMAALSQALARGLPLDRCGCFGSLLRLSPAQALAADAAMLGLACAALRWGERRFSLDRWLGGREGER